MTYTRPWTTTAPADTSAANQIGLDIRQLRQDIQDRMNSLVIDWTADPVVAQPILGGGANNKIIYIGAQSFTSNNPLGGSQTVTYTGGTSGVTSTSTGTLGPPSLYASFSIPIGVTINSVFVNLDPSTTSSVTTVFSLVNNGISPALIPLPSAGFNRTITVTPTIIPGPKLGISSGLNFTTNTGGYLTIAISSTTINSAFILFSAGVIYNCPTAVNTL